MAGTWKKIFIGAIIYIILGIVISFALPDFSVYAALISALIAGIYVGRGETTMKGLIHGLLAGLIGGVIGGFIVPFIGLGVPMGGWINDLVYGMVGPLTANPWFALPSMAIVGLIFGLIGGIIGAKLKRG